MILRIGKTIPFVFFLRIAHMPLSSAFWGLDSYLEGRGDTNPGSLGDEITNSDNERSEPRISEPQLT